MWHLADESGERGAQRGLSSQEQAVDRREEHDGRQRLARLRVGLRVGLGLGFGFGFGFGVRGRGTARVRVRYRLARLGEDVRARLLRRDVGEIWLG